MERVPGTEPDPVGIELTSFTKELDESEKQKSATPEESHDIKSEPAADLEHVEKQSKEVSLLFQF